MTTYEARDPNYETRVRDSFDRQGFMTYIGATLDSVTPGQCEIRVPYKPELAQQHGFFHGGITGAIADTAAGYASFSLMPADSTILTTEYKINLVAPAQGEALIARARVKKSGRTLTVVECDVFGQQNGKETAVAHLLATMLCLHGKNDNPRAETGS
jgi:uncharacterized protein (TIGR00369 family)